MIFKLPLDCPLECVKVIDGVGIHDFFQISHEFFDDCVVSCVKIKDGVDVKKLSLGLNKSSPLSVFFG